MKHNIYSGPCFLLSALIYCFACGDDQNAALLNAARRGKGGAVEQSVKAGANVNAKDSSGKTALHYAAENGHVATVGLLLKLGANPNLRDSAGRTPLDYALQKGHSATAEALRSKTRQSKEERLLKRSLNPSLKYPDLARFQNAIGQEACLLQSEHVWFFAPKTYESSANIIYPYLVKAYEALRQIVSVDTEYVIVVYNFPKGHPDVTGGTSNCVIRYDDSNLRL